MLEHGGMYPRYVPSGHLLYVTKGTLFAIHFDPERLEVRGAPSALGPVASNSSTGTAQFDVSLNGTLAYRPAGVEGLTTIQWLDGVGKTVPLILEAAVYNILHLSPDGNRLLFALSQGSSTDLWIYDWQTARKTRLTNGLVTSWPLWSPDGRFVVFQAAGGMFWTRADAATTPQLLTQSRNLQLPTSFAPDGTLAFSEVTPGGLGEVRTVRVESHSGQLKAGEPQSFLKTPSDNAFAAFSPDGRWLAYANSEAGGYEVYVRAYPDNGTQVQISNAGGLSPVWSRNNHELFYRTEDQRVMVASYRVSGGSFQADKPRVWFGKQLANLGQGGGFDVAPDGKRAVALMQAEAAEPAEAQHHVMLILNFFDEVRRRVGQTK